ncbi:unnamed protein product [Arctia plantaginis]|uniref:Carboxylesterase type B domain-containing protein n=1 Tax=Arctia plantaginis TaxID=874455 RepID=A0A8S1AR90_ARCPL|nr:unnamed protein product [Arctia plantaginis]
MSITYDPVSLAYQGAISIGYEGTNDVEEMYRFYEEASSEDLSNIQVTFLPCVENNEDSHSLINFDPIHKLQEGKYHKVPTMITYADTNYKPNITESFAKPPDNMADLMPNNLEFNSGVIQEKVGQIIKEFYFGNDIYITEDLDQAYFEYSYDVFIEYPVLKFAMLYAGNGPHMVYLMQFTQGTDTSTISNILDSLYKDYDGDIVLERAQTLWQNFIKIGDPTPLTTSLIPDIWQPVAIDKRDTKAIASIQMLHFEGTTLRGSPPPKNQRVLFWDNIYSKFYRSHIVTEIEKTEELYDDGTDV